VVVVIDNRRERYRAGQYAQASVELPDQAQRLQLPQGAIGQTSGQDYVWTVENGALRARIVITGRRDARAGKVEVTQGLAPDAVVLAARFDNLKEARRPGSSRSAPRRTRSARPRVGRPTAQVLSRGSAPCGSPASASPTRSSPRW
jgi:hypothetical protein